MKRLTLALFLLPAAAFAQIGSPPYGTAMGSGTVSAASPKLQFTAGPYFVPNSGMQVTSELGLVGLDPGSPTCAALPSAPGGTISTNTCDYYTVTFNAASVASSKQLEFLLSWPDPNNPTDQSEFDLFVYDASNNVVGVAFSGVASPRRVRLPIPADGTKYTVQVVPFNPEGFSYTLLIQLADVPVPPPPPAPNPQAARFQTYVSPAGLGDNAGEPSIGIDWKANDPSLKHGTVNQGGVSFFQSGPNTLRISFDDASSPAGHVWEDVSTALVQQFVLSDPIGWTDPTTGRVFSLDLIGFEGNSFMAFSDDDGKTWTPAQGGGIPGAPDHETLGGGNYAAPLPSPGPVYPHAIYYCGQDVAPEAQCSRSDDGGLTFGPGVPIYQGTDCAANGSIHGHVKVAPDGTVYVPSGSCSVGPGVAYSKDNGLTWKFSAPPGGTDSPALVDPSVAIDAAGNVYFIWQEGKNNHPLVSVSKDGGATWSAGQDVGTAFGVQNSAFVISTAGDAGRAAVGFLGTSTPGNWQLAGFGGVWHLYIATTYDTGATWTTVDVTPDDPVQIGCIWNSGGSNACRNLLDFNDMHVDSQGRVEVAFAKGCLASASCTSASAAAHAPPYPESLASKAAIARQSGGLRMFAAFDPPATAAPGAPRLGSATVDPTTGAIVVSWDAPDNGGSPLTQYSLYRGTTSGGEALLANVDPSRTSYSDGAVVAGQTYYYYVTASNAAGTSGHAGELVAGPPAATGDPCKLPGVAAATSPAGNQLGAPANAALDILSVDAAEPWPSPAGSSSLVLTMQVANLGQTPALPPNAEWKISFTVPDTMGVLRTIFFEGDTNDATTLPNGEFTYGYTGGTTDYGQGASGVVTGTFDAKTNQVVMIIDTSKPIAFTPGLNSGDISFSVNLAAGTRLNALTGQTVVLLGAQPAGIGGGLLETVDRSASGSYTMRGNFACRPDGPVVAVIEGSPNAGCAPLTVHFDASQSLDGSGDTIASYAFNFGDGSTPAAQGSPTATYTYQTAGDYTASVKATCSRGLSSSNSAQMQISVGAAPTPPAITAPSSVKSKASASASVPQHIGSQYQWSISNGTITSGQGKSSIQFKAGSRGTLTLSVTEIGQNSCVSQQSSKAVLVN